jgi:transcriptional regulator of NAD metabolism
VLRAAGVEILATPRGYLLPRAHPAHRALVAVRHTPEQTEDELTLLVDLGVKVVDVIVEHPIYGELRGSLHVASREDVRQFMEAVRRTGARLLSELTEGLHLHTLEAEARSCWPAPGRPSVSAAIWSNKKARWAEPKRHLFGA